MKLIFSSVTILVFFLLSGCTSQGPKIIDQKLIQTDPGEAKATVLVFISPDCPCSTSHEPRLRELAKAHPDIRFMGVYSGTRIEIARQHFSKAQLPFSVIYDEKYRIADQFGALKTPHVFVIGREKQLLFQGGIDDSHDASKAHQHFLARALDAIVAGQNPDPSEVRTLGCYIRQ